MTRPPAPPGIRPELQFFVDGELSAERHAAVAAAIAVDPELAAEVARLMAERNLFDRLAEDLLSRPVPRRLAEAALRPPAGGAHRVGGASARDGRAASGWRRLRYAVPLAAAMSVAVVVAVTPWTRHPAEQWRVAGEPVVTAALEARDGRLRSVRAVSFRSGGDADASGAALGRAGRFLSDGLRETVRAPDLRRAGFALEAAELYDEDGGRAIQLRYVDRDNRLFTVFIHPGAGPDRFRLLSAHHVQVCLWENEDVVTVMTGKLPQPELFRLASMAYVALSL